MVPFYDAFQSFRNDVSCVRAWRDVPCDLCVRDPCGGVCDESRDGRNL